MSKYSHQKGIITLSNHQIVLCVRYMWIKLIKSCAFTIFRYEKAQINLINYMVRNKVWGGGQSTPQPQWSRRPWIIEVVTMKITFSLAIRSNFSFFLSNFFCGFIGNEVFNVFNCFLFICVWSDSFRLFLWLNCWLRLFWDSLINL